MTRSQTALVVHTKAHLLLPERKQLQVQFRHSESFYGKPYRKDPPQNSAKSSSAGQTHHMWHDRNRYPHENVLRKAEDDTGITSVVRNQRSPLLLQSGEVVRESRAGPKKILPAPCKRALEAAGGGARATPR